MKALYEQAMEGTHHLYNGSEYVEYQPLDEEHPYFLTDEWIEGEIIYDGEKFSNIPMLFDIEKGKLIVPYPHKGIIIQMINDHLNEFTLPGHRFINLKTTTDSLTMRKGFYEVLYQGKTPVLARRTKQFTEKIQETGISRSFEESNQYFLETNGQFFRITGRRDLLRTLGGKRKELALFIRKNNLFTSNRESSIIQIARYYDSLNL